MESIFNGKSNLIKVILITIFILFLNTIIVSSLEEGEKYTSDEGFFYEEFYNEDLSRFEVKILGHKDILNLEEITIPAYIKRKRVTIIGKRAFNGTGRRDVYLRSVNIPGTVRKIEEMAFFNNRIENLNLGEGLEIIEKNAFAINEIESLILPKSLRTIENGRVTGERTEGAFFRNNIRELIIPPKLENISGFSHNQINKIIIPENIKVIDKYAFFNNNIETLIIKEGVEVIKEGAFAFNNIENISFPKSLTKIKDREITLNEEKLDVFNKNPIRGLGGQVLYGAFEGNKIKDLKIPGHIKEVGGFSNNQINNLILEEGIEKIGARGFANNNLAKVNFPNSIIEIGSNSMAITGSASKTVDIFSVGSFENNKIEYISIPEQVQVIPRLIFKNNNIKTINFNNNLKIIEAGAFKNNQIEKLILPKSIREIKGNLFVFTPDTTRVERRVQEHFFKMGAFENNKINKLNIVDSLKWIGPRSFANNNLNLEETTIFEEFIVFDMEITHEYFLEKKIYLEDDLKYMSKIAFINDKADENKEENKGEDEVYEILNEEESDLITESNEEGLISRLNIVYLILIFIGIGIFLIIKGLIKGFNTDF